MICLVEFYPGLLRDVFISTGKTGDVGDGIYSICKIDSI